jgi:hypothetical protein
MQTAAIVVPILWCFVATILSDVFDKLRSQPDPKAVKLATEIRALNVAIGKLSPVANFVEVSRLQREVGKLEKALTASRIATKSQVAAKPDIGRAVRWGVSPIAYVLFTLLFWGTPVALLPSGWFSVVSWPVGCSGGAVGFIAWAFVTHVGVSGAAGYASQALGLREPSREASGSDGLSSLLLKVLR